MTLTKPSSAIDAVTEDAFLGDRLIVRQPLKGYRAGIDAVLLAAIVSDVRGHILDIGAGVGTVGLCAAMRLPSANVVLVEREAELVGLARDNIAANGLSARVTAVQADIGLPLSTEAASILKPDSFAHVLANPPFYDEGRSTASDVAIKAASHAMPEDGLEIWARFMARMAKPGGRATMIHKAEALPRILSAFENRFGGIVILPMHPRQGEVAIRVIVQGIKGSRAPLVLKPGLILHGEGQAFRPEINVILRNGAALEI